jgi:putative sterol carrier protein
MANANSALDSLIFPSQEWFSAYEGRINEDDKYKEISEGWGVEFNGDFIFEMTEIPLDEMDSDSMPKDLREQMATYPQETNDKGYVGLAYLGLEDGQCTGASLVKNEGEVDNGFHLTATIEKWKELLRQERGIIDGLMSGDFELDGDMQKVLQYSDAAVRLTELAGKLDDEFADEKFDRD